MIIEIVPDISNEATGPAYSVRRLCQTLVEQGNALTLGVLDWGPMLHTPDFVRRFPIGAGPRRLGRSPAMSQWLEAEARTDRGLLLHNHSLWMMPNVYPGRVAKKYDVRYVVSPRGTLSEWAFNSGSKVKRVFWPLIQKPALAAVTCWHATAESEYEDIRRMGLRQPVAIIPNGIDLPHQIPDRISETRTLLFLGRIHRKKGLELLLPAWKAVQDKFLDWQLVIAGPDNGGYLGAMQRLAASLGVERVRFVGPVYGEEKWQTYRNADLFVLPTYSENFGMAVAEALAAGVPSIVSKGAPWSGIESEHAGWWIDIGIDPLVACLENALGKPPETLVEMGGRGRAWMEREYSWPEIGGRMAETYRWILASAPKPEWVREE